MSVTLPSDIQKAETLIRYIHALRQESYDKDGGSTDITSESDQATIVRVKARIEALLGVPAV